MRLKFRFLVVRVTWGKSLDRKRKQGESVTKSFKLRELNGKNRDVYFTIRGKIQLTFGDFAVGEILQSFRVLYCNASEGLIAMRICHDYAEELVEILHGCKVLLRQEVLLKVVNITSTIRRCKMQITKALKKRLSKGETLDKKTLKDIEML